MLEMLTLSGNKNSPIRVASVIQEYLFLTTPLARTATIVQEYLSQQEVILRTATVIQEYLHVKEEV